MTDERKPDDRGADALGEWIGHVVASDPESAVWRDERFLKWLGDDAGAREDRRTSDARAEARGRALLVRALSRRYHVRRVGEAPARYTAEAPPPAGDRVSPLVELGVAAGVGRELWDEPVDQWVAVPGELPGGEYISLKVVGQSMAPLMHTGDTVLVRRGAELQPDTIVVARHPDDGYVCKAVRRVTARQVELTSIEPGRPVIRIPRDASLVLGTVLMVWCPHRLAAPD